MEIKLIEQSKNKLVLNIEGQGHSLCNSLKKELWNDKDVTVAGYYVEHPQVGIPTFIVETKGKKSPQDALVNAAKRMKKENDKFLKEFLKEVK